jgi:DnaK suppressor protein
VSVAEEGDVDDQVADRLKAILEQEQRALRGQLREHGIDPDADTGLEMTFEGGFADSAQTTAERSEVLALVEGLRRNLADVERALDKIERGEAFGLCERCHEPVAPERLEALPWARLCIACKQRVG